MWLERQVVEFCSPTLSGIKTGSLFNFRYEGEKELSRELTRLNESLNAKGVYFRLLKMCKERALIYVYREKKLDEELAKEEVSEFLGRMGYAPSGSQAAVEKLNEHFMEGNAFPHEIGVFLGYPIGDVIAFIENKGRNSKYTGCWKVYGNVDEAKEQFMRFRRCTEIYIRSYERGKNLRELTVSA